MTSRANSEPDGGVASLRGSEEPWTLALLVRRHRRAAAVSVAVLAIMIAAIVVPVILDHRPLALTDASSCSQWASAPPALQTAYGHLHINEYGQVANTPAHAAAVREQVDRACTYASYLGQADNISIIAALKGAF